MHRDVDSNCSSNIYVYGFSYSEEGSDMIPETSVQNGPRVQQPGISYINVRSHISLQTTHIFINTGWSYRYSDSKRNLEEKT